MSYWTSLRPVQHVWFLGLFPLKTFLIKSIHWATLPISITTYMHQKIVTWSYSPSPDRKLVSKMSSLNCMESLLEAERGSLFLDIYTVKQAHVGDMSPWEEWFQLMERKNKATKLQKQRNGNNKTWSLLRVISHAGRLEATATPCGATI